jgi:hypothetical protein
MVQVMCGLQDCNVILNPHINCRPIWLGLYIIDRNILFSKQPTPEFNFDHSIYLNQVNPKCVRYWIFHIEKCPWQYLILTKEFFSLLGIFVELYFLLKPGNTNNSLRLCYRLQYWKCGSKTLLLNDINNPTFHTTP